MLTKNDLQQIREVVSEDTRAIVREEVRAIVKEEVSVAIKEEVRPIIREEVSNQLKPVNRKLNRIQKDMKLMADDYTNAIVHVRKRMEKIEDHLNLS